MLSVVSVDMDHIIWFILVMFIKIPVANATSDAEEHMIATPFSSSDIICRILERLLHLQLILVMEVSSCDHGCFQNPM